MGLFRKGEVVGIARSAMDFALAASAETHPREYMGLLRGDDAAKFDVEESGTVITDVLVIPGTESNPVSATVKTSMIPNDHTAAGSVHSHPNGVLRPSDEDLITFGKGSVHIIIGHPYGENDWQAFDREGEPRDLPVLDVDPPEETFFDFSQADIDDELREERRTGGREDWRTDGDDGWRTDEGDGWRTDGGGQREPERRR